MNKVNKEKKIENLIDNEQIFMLSETDKYQYFICKGNDKNYDVIYFKGQDKWKCECKNVRLTHCYHIEAAKILKGKNENDFYKESFTKHINVGGITIDNIGHSN